MSQLPRRTFLVASGLGFAGLQFGRPQVAAAAPAETNGGRAKSTILFFLCGGSSHIDMWDLKPKAPIEYRGEFNPIATSAPGLFLSEHLPLTAQQGHHLAVIRSIDGAVNTNDHHAGYYHNLTGHRPDPSFLSLGNNRTPMPDDWPYLGCVAASRRPPHPTLTNAITLPFKPSRAPYTRPGQFAARLGVEFDPLYVDGNFKEPLKFHAPSLVLDTKVNSTRLTERNALLQSVDAARRNFDAAADAQLWSRQQERAVSLLMSSAATDAFDVSRESPEVRARYGETINGMSLLLARRLVEAGVPFVTVFWVEHEGLVPERCKSGGGWDTHGSNFACLRENLLPDFDRGYSALIGDLHDRGLLDQTLVMITSEMGRKPKIGDPRSGGTAGAGRDHWTYCLSDVLAGGGIKGGQAYGASDKFGEYPADNPCTPGDVAKTVYHAMGIHDLEARDRDGRVFNLLAEGEPLVSLF
ncbi:MAG: DUF1501 domain-containing protein [Planctomycetaceae bacterium]|nr:DUF1501 domain-containing protein [Planctomycetaceae bacterium]